MRDRHGNPNLKIRMDVQPGGCLAWHYRLSLTEELQADDQRLVVQDLDVFIGADSQPYLSEVVVDYSEDLMGGGFRFQNSNAAQTCSCGNSFSVLPAESERSTETSHSLHN